MRLICLLIILFKVVPTRANELFYVNILESLPSKEVMTRNCAHAENPTLLSYCQVEESICESNYFSLKDFSKGSFSVLMDKPDYTLILYRDSVVVGTFSSSEWGLASLQNQTYPSVYKAFAIKQYGDYDKIKSTEDYHPRKFRPKIFSFDLFLKTDKEKATINFPSKYSQIPLKFSSFEKESEITFKIGNKIIQNFNSGNEDVVLQVSEGLFPLTFEYRSVGEVLTLTREVLIKQDEVIPLNIDRNDFRPQAQRLTYYDYVLSDKFPIEFKNITHFTLKEAQLVEPNGDVHNFSKSLNADFKTARINDPKIEKEIAALFKKHPLSYFRIHGLCQNVTLGEIKSVIDVFTTDKGKDNKIGFFEIKNNAFINTKEVNFISLNNVVSEVESSFVGYCFDKEVLGIGAKGQNGSRVELGIGPWGNSAWIEGKTHSILTDIAYRLPKYGPVTLESIKQDKIEISPVGTDEVEEIPLSEVFDIDGKARYKFSCK